MIMKIFTYYMLKYYKQIDQCSQLLGAQIIDLMMLVVDITKGIQTQTAEVGDGTN